MKVKQEREDRKKAKEAAKSAAGKKDVKLAALEKVHPIMTACRDTK